METNKLEALYQIQNLTSFLIERERLKEVQGPERHLVGQSRSDGRQDGVEEAKPGRRGVGEIGGAAKLRRHLERKIEEARIGVNAARDESFPVWVKPYNDGLLAGLLQLRDDFDCIAEKRSDLSNA